MASFPSYKALLTCAVLLVLLSSSSAKLYGPDYYSIACPNLTDIVRNVVARAIKNQARMGASLLRMHFHDCFINGCDGSILLDDTPTLKGEKNAGPNKHSLRGYDVIDHIKEAVEKKCPGVVSCADILAIAARDSVNILGGPSWQVQLGRRDSRTANFSLANSSLPSGLPSPQSNLTTLIMNFKAHGLSVHDLVTLSGAHTIGQARCVSFRAHIYNDSNVDTTFANSLKSICPSASGSNDNNLAPLDAGSSTIFDNHYYVDLFYNKGLLHSDQELYNGNSSTAKHVVTYLHNTTAFAMDFAKAMVKMGNMNPLTGSNGEIRKNCRRGCDASVLLKDTSTFTGEQSATPNKNSIRKLEVIDQIKSEVETKCPGMVSCADILAIAARDAVDILSGNKVCYMVEMGRLDSTTANKTAANNLIPPPTSSISDLITNFKNHGLTETDLVLLAGAHTIGKARCTSFKNRLYNETNSLDKNFANNLRRICSPDDSKTGNNTADLDYQTPNVFDNHYYQNIIANKTLLHSDHQLLNNSDTKYLVSKYSNDNVGFSREFGQAMINMGRLKRTAGEKMEIRKTCWKQN
ncbi:peroxidase [Striga asiatica]|uniref:peroxidase n=1 Tax=Striga asiatica TaxID=4170 RepID=A0A5A7R3Q2_STRAF|nr:peroxidase [Striga asiatica]